MSFIILGIFAGLLAGMFGIGGGIVIVPALILIFNFAAQQASGTSLAALLLPAGSIALLQYKKAGLLNIKVSALIALGIFIGSASGAAIALNINAVLLKQLYGAFLLWVGWRFAKPREWFSKDKKKILNNDKNEDYDFSKTKLYIFFLIGIFAGVFAGLFGIGGGIIITAILIGILKIPAKQATAISLAALFLPSGLPGVIQYYNADLINIWTAVFIAIGIELGSAISARAAIKTTSSQIKKLYGCLVFIIGIYFILQNVIF
ncbi:MAG: sulfite exporter TauE/SafE family protein [Bacteroidetes bacterium]|nr:sulfite exporter TauE/SafE family protein [Bacteroidota bacterium]